MYASTTSMKRHLRFPHSKTCAPSLFLYLLYHSSLNFRNLSYARFISLNLKVSEPTCDHQKVPLFFIYGILKYFLPIASSNNCTMHTLWVVFPFPALYQCFFWFFCVFTSSSSSLSLLHSLQTIAFSFSSPSSCFSLNHVFHWSLTPSFLSPL